MVAAVQKMSTCNLRNWWGLRGRMVASLPPRRLLAAELLSPPLKINVKSIITFALSEVELTQVLNLGYHERSFD